MSKVELKKRWWIGVKPKTVKGAELEKALALVESTEDEKLVAALATLKPALAKAWAMPVPIRPPPTTIASVPFPPMGASVRSGPADAQGPARPRRPSGNSPRTRHRNRVPGESPGKPRPSATPLTCVNWIGPPAA